MAIIQVGSLPESNTYVKKKLEMFRENEFAVEHVQVDEKSEKLEEEIISQIKMLNNDDSVSGIILQLPLPQGINAVKILEHIDTIKDIDGFHMTNFAKLSLDNYYPTEAILPCTVRGIVDLLDFYDIKVQGKDITVIGKGIAVGLPLTLCLMARGATVTSCDIHTTNIQDKISNADIVISATDVPHLIDADWINKKSFVIDVGSSVFYKKKQDGKEVKKITGNVNLSSWKYGNVTPVPGGVGVMTVISAMVNCIEAFFKKREIENN